MREKISASQWEAHRDRMRRLQEFAERDQQEQAEWARLMRDGRFEEAMAIANRRRLRAAIDRAL